MTLKQMLEAQRARVAAKLAERQKHTDAINTIRAALGDDSRDLTAEETASITTADEARTRIDAELDQLRAKETELAEELKRDEAADSLAREYSATGSRATPADTARGGAHVTSEARAYSRENDPQGRQFIADVTAQFLGRAYGDVAERLSRHQREEQIERGAKLQRSVTTVGAPGLVVPQYLIDLYAPKARPGRKFADACRHVDLPASGMTVYLPRQTTATDVQEQVAELDLVAENDYGDESIPVKVRTNAGSQTISRQAIERSLGTEDLVVEDLIRSYNVTLDARLINAPLWGLSAVATAVTFTDASPTAAKLYAKIQEANAGVEDAMLDLDEDDLFTLMHGRRWAWMKSQTTDKWPFINRGIAGNGTAAVTGDDRYTSAIRGELPDGGPVITDNNIAKTVGTGTNQDDVFEVARQEAFLWEDPSAPLFIRGEQVKKLGIDLVLYGYFAACFNRRLDPVSGTAVHRKITGTGLVTPSFTG